MNLPAGETKANLRKWWRPDVHNERRSLTLCAVAAVLGLAIAGVGLFNARGTRIAGVPPEDAAVVNRSPILLSDYVAQLQALYNVSPSQATPAQKRATLNSMIREELYVQRGIELGLQNDFMEVRNSLVSAVEAPAGNRRQCDRPHGAGTPRFLPEPSPELSARGADDSH